MRLRLLLVSLCAAYAAGCSCGGAAFSPDDAARICTTLQVCSPREFSQRFGGSMEACTTNFGQTPPTPGALENDPVVTTGLEGPIKNVYSCLLGARGQCSKANQCWAQTGDVGTCSPASGLAAGGCNSGVLSGCTADGQKFAVDCGKSGDVCGRINAFVFSINVCGVAACGSGNKLACRGSKAEVCAGEVLWLADCGREGLSCGSPDGGNATCIGASDKTCDPKNNNPTCDGTVVVSCTSDGFTTRVDCAAQPTNRRCDNGKCVPTGNQCGSETTTSCEGTGVTFCQDGFTKHFDCVGEGFGPCNNGACTAK